MKTYKTIQEAAVAGLRAAQPKTAATGHEYGGFIQRTSNGEFTFIETTSDEEGHIDLAGLVEKITGFDLSAKPRPRVSAVKAALMTKGIVSIYHVHPCNNPVDTKFAKYFSPADMTTFISMGLQSIYLAVSCTGEVRLGTKDLPVVWPVKGDPTPAALGPIVAHL